MSTTTRRRTALLGLGLVLAIAAPAQAKSLSVPHDFPAIPEPQSGVGDEAV
jgi:hypothetical protein